jgi:hypothetical protein
MQRLRVNLSSGGGDEFLALLTESEINFIERRPQLGVLVASLSALEIIGVVGSSLAAVLVKWLHGRATRMITIQTTKNAFVTLKGYSPEQVTEILNEAVSLNVIQRTKDDT